MAKFGFDTTEVTPDNGSGGGNYDPVPEGEYLLQALDAEERTTQRGDGSYIKAKFEIVAGAHAGRWIWQNFNIHNPSAKAQQIGRQQLMAWAAATGRPDAEDSDQLLGRQFRALVAVEPGSGGYGPSNKIKAFLFDAAPAAGASKKPSPPAAKPAPRAAAPAASSGANPWD